MSDIPEVLASARFVTEHARFVRIDERAVRSWADAQEADRFGVLSMPRELQFSGDRDTCANLTLMLSCLNFCFWSDMPWAVDFCGKTWTRTFAMYAAVFRAVEEDPAWLTPQRWAMADEAAVAELFRGKGEIPLRSKRREVLNETGRSLIERFDGRFAQAAERTEAHARKLAYATADGFPSFRDVAVYLGRPIALLKRAQICAADLHRLWRACGYPGLAGMDELTLFADYRLPQYLRHVGIIVLETGLADRIERREEIRAGSAEEVELRCATIMAGELIRRALRQALPVWRLDYVLWQRSHDPDVSVPHHRTRTVFY